MAERITLSCPSCGALLQPAPVRDTYSCVYCGNRYIVRQEGGLARTEAVIESVREILGEIGAPNQEPNPRRTGDELASLMLERDSIQARLTRLNEEKATSILRRRARWILAASGMATLALFVATVCLFRLASARLTAESLACPAIAALLVLASGVVVSARALGTLVSAARPRPLGELEQETGANEQALLRTVEAVDQIRRRSSDRR